MTDKPTWPRKAAKEIMEELPIKTLAKECQVWGGPNPNAEIKPESLRDIIWDCKKSVETEQQIEAIILSHCPDKGVGKLVAILKRLDAWGQTGIGISKSMLDILKDTRVALADYEATNE